MTNVEVVCGGHAPCHAHAHVHIMFMIESGAILFDNKICVRGVRRVVADRHDTFCGFKLRVKHLYLTIVPVQRLTRL